MKAKKIKLKFTNSKSWKEVYLYLSTSGMDVFAINAYKENEKSYYTITL